MCCFYIIKNLAVEKCFPFIITKIKSWFYTIAQNKILCENLKKFSRKYNTKTKDKDIFKT